jgi:hypothetical protein
MKMIMINLMIDRNIKEFKYNLYIIFSMKLFLMKFIFLIKRIINSY